MLQDDDVKVQKKYNTKVGPSTMPVRRGHLAPAHTYIETVIRKFDGCPGRNFVIGNALSEDIPIIYCNSSFCELTGYDRHELVQRTARCDFLHGPETADTALLTLKEALSASDERHFETYYYKKNGEKFFCSIIVAPIKNEQGSVILYIVNHEEIQTEQHSNGSIHEQPASPPQRKISTMFRNSFRRKKSVISKKSEKTLEEEEEGGEKEEESTPLNTTPQDITPPPPSDPIRTESPNVIQNIDIVTTSPGKQTDPLIRLESPMEETYGNSLVNNRASSLNDFKFTTNQHNGFLHKSVDNDTPIRNSLTSENHLNNHFYTNPSTTTEQETTRMNILQRKLTGRAASLVTPGTTKKVAQVMSLGSDVLPEYKVESPKIHPWTILHYSPFKAIWDWVVLFLVMYTAIITPYMAAFVLTRHPKEHSAHSYNTKNSPISIVDDPLIIVDYIVDVMFIIDIFINFRTTFVDENDEVVSDPCRVAVNYMKGWFIVDLLAAIPFELLIMIGDTDQTTTLIGLLKTARLLRLVRVARKLDRYSEYGYALLMLLMFGFALVAHWLACVWYAIGNFERPDDNKELSWLTQLGVATRSPYNQSDPDSGPSLETKYLTALYFTLSSLTSVGFGNVSANTNGEKIFTILIMFLGALMHAVIFGNVTAIIQRLYSGMAHYHATMRKVREFIRFYQIPSPLRQRLEDYAQYDYSYTNGIDMNEVLRNFPEGLQADICLHLNRHLLSSNPAFRGSTPGCLRALSLKLCTTHCPPGDYIIHHGDEISNLFWIGRGTVEIIQNELIIAILGKGDSFGENFTNNRSSGKARASVRALTYCDLHSISRDNLLYIMNAYPEFKRNFNEEMQITYDLKDSEVDNKEMYTSFNSVYTHHNGRRPSSFSPGMMKDNNLTKSFTEPLDIKRTSKHEPFIKKQHSKSFNEQTRHHSTINEQLDDSMPSYSCKQNTNELDNETINTKGNFSNNDNSTNNNNNSPACHHCSSLKKDIDEMRHQILRLESSMRDDVKLIVGLLRSRNHQSPNKRISDSCLTRTRTATGDSLLTNDTSV